MQINQPSESSVGWNGDNDELLNQELCSDASVFIVDPKFRITWANEGFFRQNLTHQHEVLGQPAQQFLPKRFFTEQGKASIGMSQIRACLASGEVCRAEASHYRRDGTSFWVAVDFVPVTDEDGVMTTCFVMQRDITVLRERRLQLHRTSMIARYTNNPVVITGPDFIVEWVNDAWVRQTGYSLEEIRGREARDLLSGPKTDESQVLEAYRIVREGRCASYEITYYRKDGSAFIVAVDAYPVADAAGEDTNFFAVYRDITESRRTRDELLRMAMVAQYTENGVMIVDAQGAVEWINRGFTALLGYAMTDLEGREAKSLLVQPELVDWERVIGRLQRRKSISATTCFSALGGDTCELDVDLTPIFDDEGQLLNVIVIQRRHQRGVAEGPSTRH